MRSRPMFFKCEIINKSFAFGWLLSKLAALQAAWRAASLFNK